MTDKPDLPVVHLPWSSWQDITARLDALEAAVSKLGHHALHGLQQRDRPELSVLLAKVNGYAPATPPAAPCADEVEVVARALVESSGFGWYDDPMEGGQDAFDICEDAKGDARRALAALSPLRQAERERAWREGAEATRCALAGYAETRGETKMAEVMRAFPLPPAPALGGQKP